MKLGIIATQIADDSSAVSFGSSLFFDEMPPSAPPRGEVKDLARASSLFARPAPRPARPAATKSSRRRA